MRWLIGSLALVAAGCTGSSPVAPTVPAPIPVAACQSGNTATVYFQNRSASNLTYDIIWDGARLTTVAPGADSQVYTFAANIQHTLRFQFTNTSVNACNPGTPILATCASTFYGCGT